MRSVPKFLWTIVACLVCIIITAAACLIMSTKGKSSDKYLEVLDVIDENYYMDADTTALEDASASAMLAALNNEQSYYIPASEYEEYKLSLTNQYVGIGITTEYSEKYGYLSVVSVTAGSPADNAYIKVGNLISAVNDIDVSGYTPDELLKLFQTFDANESEEDKYFNIHLFNAQGGKATVKLKCELIYSDPVTYYVLEDTNIGYIKIYNFDDSSAAALKSAVEQLQSLNVRSIILDVRDNTSGKPAELADALDYLLPKGDLFILRDNVGKETTYSSSKSSVSMNFVLLTNQQTTCAAEMFAYIMQNTGNCKVVGRQTSANSQSQVIVELEDGSAIRISKYEYLTPDKKSMTDLGGVSPDVTSYYMEDSTLDVQLEAAKDLA